MGTGSKQPNAWSQTEFSTVPVLAKCLGQKEKEALSKAGETGRDHMMWGLVAQSKDFGLSEVQRKTV